MEYHRTTKMGDYNRMHNLKNTVAQRKQDIQSNSISIRLKIRQNHSILFRNPCIYYIYL